MQISNTVTCMWKHYKSVTLIIVLYIFDLNAYKNGLCMSVLVHKHICGLSTCNVNMLSHCYVWHRVTHVKKLAIVRCQDQRTACSASSRNYEILEWIHKSMHVKCDWEWSSDGCINECSLYTKHSLIKCLNFHFIPKRSWIFIFCTKGNKGNITAINSHVLFSYSLFQTYW